ncbi:MAG: SCO family protein [Pseudomonadota bacterium]
MRRLALVTMLLALHSAGAGSAPPLPDTVEPFPIDIRVAFDLVDQDGVQRTENDLAGRPAAIFFGYANCEAICSVALPRLAAALELLGPEGEAIQPILITVDPERDTPEAMREALPKYHQRLIGLTGSEAALAAVREVFQVESKVVWREPDGAPIYAHGSFIYLIGADGEVKTLLPPILSEQRIAALMRKYL